VKRSIFKYALIAATLLWAGASLAADSKPATPAGEPKAAATDAKKAQSKPKAKPVDINSASKAELKKLTSIGDAEADRIIAGRPYLSKADLVTRNIIPRGVYEQIRQQIIAVQKPEYVKQKSQPETKK
jgi:competence protein ComEA